MKRTLIIEILLLFVTVVVLTLGIWCLKAGIMSFNAVHIQHEQELIQYAYMYLIFGICGILATFATVAAIVLIALKDFPVFKPWIDAKKQAKAEKAAADKQARIERLQSELDELKKDE